MGEYIVIVHVNVLIRCGATGAYAVYPPSFTQNVVVLRKTGKNRHVFGLKSGQKPMKEQS